MKRSYASPETSKLTRRSVSAARDTFATVPSQTRAPAADTLALGRRPGEPCTRRGERSRADAGSTLRRREGPDRRVGRPRARARVEALRRARELDELHAAPGNPGIAALGQCHPVRAEDGEGLLSLCRELGIDLVVVGPGGAARRRARGHAPPRRGRRRSARAKAAARIEGSKSFAKDVLEAAGVPTAQTPRRRAAALRRQGRTASRQARASSSAARRTSSTPACAPPPTLGGDLLIEELLEGEEVSLFALCDGEHARRPRSRAGLQAGRRRRHRPEHRRHGRVLAGARPRRAEVEELLETVHRPVLAELARRDAPFIGPALRRADAHRGRPAGARVQLPLRRSGDAVDPAADRGRPPAAARCGAQPASSQASLLRRGRGRHGGAGRRRLSGAERQRDADRRRRGRRGDRARSSSTPAPRATAARLVTNGGRILNVTATGDDVGAARTRAYEAASRISFAGMRYRRDIALSRGRGSCPQLTARSSASWSAPSPTARRCSPRSTSSSARDPARVRSSFGAPQPGRRRRVRADGAGARDPGADRRRRPGRGAARRRSPRIPTCR